MWQFTVRLYVYTVILPGSHQGNSYSTVNYQSMTSKQLKEWFSPGNNKFMDEKFTGGMEFHWESIANRHRLRVARSKCEQNPPNNNNSRISSSKLLFTANVNFLKI
jgi:hypothetical protein